MADEMLEREIEAVRSAVMGVPNWHVSSAPDAPTNVEVAGNIARAAVAALARLESSRWRPIAEAPCDDEPVLLFTTCHGQVEAWFSPGRWHDYVEGREYDGPVWVCADDTFQIEIEETPEGLRHGTATHWMPLYAPPSTTSEGE